MTESIEEQPPIFISAEECEPADFDKYHYFSRNDDQIIRKLIAHGPVLLRGGRGSGKSALMKAAERKLEKDPQLPVFGLYISLRHIELIRSSGTAYEVFLCRLLLDKLREKLDSVLDISGEPTVSDVQYTLATVSSKLQKRIVLLFDDAAHLGRETSLAEFFDIFRTISSSTVSCKAAIYPGVTKFGIRFDIFNDATVLDLSRSDELEGHNRYFSEIMERRFPHKFPDAKFREKLTKDEIAGFMGTAVLGNMRSFIVACSKLNENFEGTIGLTELESTLKEMASNHFWPLLEEVEPKLGKYAPMVSVARDVAERLFEAGGRHESRSALILRALTERLAKPVEILEYAGFISKREASRAMKSGGRGARYALNLCNLLENIPNARLTSDLYRKWKQNTNEPVQFNSGSRLQEIELPLEEGPEQPEIMSMSIEILKRSPAYPYGLSQNKMDVLHAADIKTVGDLASASDSKLLGLWGIGDSMLHKIRNVVGQAIWM